MRDHAPNVIQDRIQHLIKIQGSSQRSSRIAQRLSQHTLFAFGAFHTEADVDILLERAIGFFQLLGTLG